MTRADELLALAERVEALTGPDRETELAIWRLIDPRAPEVEAQGRTPLAWLHCYTSSLDTALKLGGGKTTLLRLTEDGGDNCALACVGCHTLADAPVFEGRSLETAMRVDALVDLAIATTAANLRVLAAIETGAAA